MFPLKSLVLWSLYSLAYASHPMLDGRIVGGYDVNIQDFPYQLSLQSYGRHICGATIISENWVLTAAHCVRNSDPKKISFRAGSTFREQGGSEHNAEEIHVHPENSNLDYDYALVKVSEPFKLGEEGVDKIKLATESPKESTLVVTSGWGTLHSGGSLPKNLQAVTIPVINHTTCEKQYNFSYEITQRMLCAGDLKAGGKDSCQGDSGGPLVDRWARHLVGVVSWGLGCADATYPGVYADVSIARQWIKDVTQV